MPSHKSTTRQAWAWLKRMALGAAEVFAPVAYCAECGAALNSSEVGVCRLCLDRLPVTSFEAWSQNPVKTRMDGRIPLVSAFSCYYFHKGETLRRLIHQFKYSGNRNVATDLGREMGRRASAAGFTDNYDALIPVPLHWRREWRRGYNQSLVLARGIAEVTGLQVMTDVLLRRRAAPTQTHLNAEQRHLNVRNVFSLGRGAQRAKGMRLLLVDDVFTTGATSEACLEKLLEIEGVKLGLATLGYASS